MISMSDDFLYTLNSAPIRKFIYSAWSFYATRRGGELPGPWILEALGSLGRSSGSVRQTLFRMERDQELNSRRVGRMKYYWLTVSAQQEIASGLAMFFDPTRNRLGRLVDVRAIRFHWRTAC